MQEREDLVVVSSRAWDAPTHPPDPDDGDDGDGGLTEPRVTEDGDVPNGGGRDNANQSTNGNF